MTPPTTSTRPIGSVGSPSSTRRPGGAASATSRMAPRRLPGVPGGSPPGEQGGGAAQGGCGVGARGRGRQGGRERRPARGPRASSGRDQRAAASAGRGGEQHVASRRGQTRPRRGRSRGRRELWPWRASTGQAKRRPNQMEKRGNEERRSQRRSPASSTRPGWTGATDRRRGRGGCAWGGTRWRALAAAWRRAEGRRGRRR